MTKIEEQHLLDLIHWARRYCDGRRTYAPSRFNQLYEYIVHLNPKLKEKDYFDETLMEKGRYWPYAQDGQYDSNTGHYDAIPMKLGEIEKIEE